MSSIKQLLCRLSPVLALVALNGFADDLLPLEHSLRYVGRDGRTPVVVEFTLRERLGGELEYVRWVTPTQWGAWFSEPAATRCRLRYRDGTLATIDVDDGLGAKRPPSDLSAGALDALAVRLRARRYCPRAETGRVHCLDRRRRAGAMDARGLRAGQR